MKSQKEIIFESETRTGWAIIVLVAVIILAVVVWL